MNKEIIQKDQENKLVQIRLLGFTSNLSFPILAVTYFTA